VTRGCCHLLNSVVQQIKNVTQRIVVVDVYITYLFFSLLTYLAFLYTAHRRLALTTKGSMAWRWGAEAGRGATLYEP